MDTGLQQSAVLAEATPDSMASPETSIFDHIGFQSLLSEHDGIRTHIRALANAELPGERVQLRKEVFTELERHFRFEENILYPALAASMPADFLNDRLARPAETIRALMRELTAMRTSEADFVERVDELGRLVHRFLMHEEALLPPSAKRSSASRYSRLVGATPQQ